MFSSSSATGLLALASVLTAVNGHMIMKTPTPYGQSSLDNSPLFADGSNFPCKLRTGGYDMPSTGTNTMAIGESQTLSFTGSAVHGGGSCQISLTTDKAPTAKSTWQVIHSIEGGCPATAAGNLDGNDATTFQFSIPTGIATGDYTLAWTWFNKIGNREMYMNCAPVSVTAAKKKRYAPTTPAKRATSFPAMAVANINNINGCGTSAGNDTIYPEAGSSVDKIGSGPFTGFIQSPTSPNLPCSLLPDSASGSAASSAPAASAPASSASSASAPAASATSAAALTQSSAGSFATASANPVASSVSVASAAPTAASSAAVSAASPASTGSASGGNATGSAGASCSTEGQTVCAADGQSYLECASGYWQTMAVAAGTKCSGTVSDSINIVAAGKRHVRQHMRRAI